MAAANALTLALLCLAVGASALRTHAGVNATQEEAAHIGCTDYCVQCNDGSTVWYGRSRAWIRTMASLFTEGLLFPVVAVGNSIMKATEEEFSSWMGYLPTTGFFCEKVDVVKFPAGQEPLAYTPLMLADLNWFGRLMLNELKPYYPTSAAKEWAQPGDLEAYKKGCKVMKAAGMKGSAKQFASNFQPRCQDAVTRGVHTCSEHSRLCGAGGVRRIVAGAHSVYTCRAWKGDPLAPDMCPGVL